MSALDTETWRAVPSFNPDPNPAVRWADRHLPRGSAERYLVEWGLWVLAGVGMIIAFYFVFVGIMVLAAIWAFVVFLQVTTSRQRL